MSTFDSRANERLTTTTGPSYPCWYCGGRVLDGCTHHCPTVTPVSPPGQVIYPGTSGIAPGLVKSVFWP